ncbi:uncharacterized protein LOC120091338 isoform X2 [Benincasa hispida]|uniref:uncharacterized protein LOC120091338 isoform X2 n=1 Tax=Benincasa hispida TaxID=102211 RepID=UPI001900A02C|nr:uncharacterized protein LOC120091338 isoform X2 [Benincasa hispida]
MERDGEGAPAAAASSSSQTIRPRRRVDPLLVTCRFFSVLTALTAILCIVSNVISAIRSFKNKSDVLTLFPTSSLIVIACFVVLAETEWEFILKNWKVLEYWAGRGMLQIFVAVMTRAFPVYSVEQRELILLQDAASYLLLACGAVYVVSGILCIGFLKRAREEKETAKDRVVKDLQELERQKQELEQLLISETV